MGIFSKLFSGKAGVKNQQVKVSINTEIADHEHRATACVQEMCEYIRNQLSASGVLSESEIDLIECEASAFAAAFLNLHLEHHFFPNPTKPYLSNHRLSRLFKRSRMAVKDYCDNKYGFFEFNDSYLAYRMHMAGGLNLDAINKLNRSRITAKITNININSIEKILQSSLDRVDVLIPKYFPEHNRRKIEK